MTKPSAAPALRSASSSTEQSCPAPAQVTDIDPDGDLVLRVGAEFGKAIAFRVCSGTMRRASPVWKKMLFGPWKESKPSDGAWFVDLPDDKPWPVQILLAIIHSKFNLVYSFMTLSQLHDILVVTDKYDMISVIRPWASDWVQVTQSLSPPQIMSGHDHVFRIHAAWELGIDKVLSSEVMDLVLNSSIFQEGTELRVMYRGEQLSFDSHAGPDDLVEIIADLRLSLIQRLVDFYHAEIVNRTQESGFACREPGLNFYAAPASEKLLCDSVILGGILRAEKREKRDSLPQQADKVLESANAVMGFLSSVFSTLPCLNDRHRECSPTKKYAEFEATIRADPQWTNVSRPQHKQRMAAQRKKLGLMGPDDIISELQQLSGILKA